MVTKTNAAVEKNLQDDAVKAVETEEKYLAEIVSLGNRVGCGGCVRQARVRLMDSGKELNRLVMGAMKKGDLIWLMDNVRESRRSR